MKTKVISSKAGPSIRGGSGKMFGKQHSGTQAPGQTATKASNVKAGKGGPARMLPKKPAGPSKAC